MRKFVVFVGMLIAALVFGASTAWAGGTSFENHSDFQLTFHTQGIKYNGAVTEWGTTSLAPHQSTRLRCHECVAFNFEIRTEGRRPLHYRLELDHDYKLRYNREKREWDLFR